MIHKQSYRRLTGFERSYYADAAMAGNRISAGASNEVQKPLRRLDPLFSQLSHLGLVTVRFKQEYCFNRRQALEGLLQELTLIQKLYEGSPLGVEPGQESSQSGAMELNSHLMQTANFGQYSNAEKINILYQLRRVVEMLYKRQFAQ
jgi:hypothetical protein